MLRPQTDGNVFRLDDDDDDDDDDDLPSCIRVWVSWRRWIGLRWQRFALELNGALPSSIAV
eukprot:2991209-Amphidinium_carterae.1